jgi:hypothetical protein
MLSKEKKTELTRELAFFREHRENWTQRVRLVALPFVETLELFGLKERVDCFPCTVFGKQLVLKIIDELLDTTPSGKETF